MLGAHLRGLALLLAVATAQAQPLSIEDVFRLAAFAEPTLSDDGRHFAVTVPVNDRRNLVVIDMDTRKGTRITDFKDFDVIDERNHT